MVLIIHIALSVDLVHADCIIYSRVDIPSKRFILDMTLNWIRWWSSSSGDHGVPLHCHYSQVYFDPFVWACYGSTKGSNWIGYLNRIRISETIQLYMNYLHLIGILDKYLPNPSAWAGCDTRSTFKLSLIGVKLEFSFS